MASELPPSERGPLTALEDTILDAGEVFTILVPYDMSQTESTDPVTWTTSSGRSPPPHPCVLLTRTTSGSMIDLTVFILRSFGGRPPREVTEMSPTANEFLPLPSSNGEPAMTPAAFGEPLSIPGLRMRSQTWLLIHPSDFSVRPGTKVKRFDPRVRFSKQEIRRVFAYRETLRSRVLAGHGPTLAPAPGQISPNHSRTPTTRTDVTRGRLLAPGVVAGQTGGRGNDRRSDVGVPERGEASLVPTLERMSFRDSPPRVGATGQTGGRESNREPNVGVPVCGEVERGEASVVPALDRTSTVRASVSRGSTTGQTDGLGRGRDSNVRVAESGEAERGETIGGLVSNGFEGRPGYVGGGRARRAGRAGRAGRGGRGGRGLRGERRGRGRWRGGGGGGGGGEGGGGGGRGGGDGEGRGGGGGGSRRRGGGSWRRAGERNMGGSPTSVSGRGGGSKEGQEARVARTEPDLTRWAKETPDIFFRESPYPTFHFPPGFGEDDWDDDQDDDWTYGLPLPFPWSELIETEKRFLAENFHPEITKLSIDEWLQEIS